jgi:hypothetical protein
VRRPAPLALIVVVFAIAGCGSNEEKAPAACLSGPKFYYSALLNGADVTFSGFNRISDCLVRNQSSGDLANVGTSLVRTTTQLNARARQNLGGLASRAATFRLGYLVGAVARGASDTGGIHSVLLDRVTAAATYSPAGRPLPRDFRRLYRKGYAQGRDHG